MKPITREEMYLAAAAGYDVAPPEPITRKEVFLAKLAGMEVETPVPFTRRERFLEAAALETNKAVIESLEITENGAYTAPEGVDGYNPVVVNVAGSSADLRYVTFMSYDGLVEYGKKAVAVGDDCADPIARGIFATPTRESDVQYNYTFYGWATEPNGGADSNAIKAVEEDRTVYANFSKSIRHYNARFYSDGKLVATVSTAYGAQAVPPEISAKEGYTLGGWNPSDLTIYADTDFHAVWTEMKGYFYVTTLSGFPNTYISDLAINNAGTEIAIGMSGSGAPYVYDISGENPVLKPINSTSVKSLQRVDYNYNDTVLYGYTGVYNSSYKYEGTMRTYNISNGTYGTGVTTNMGTNTMNSSIMRCSPVDSKYAVGVPEYSESYMELNNIRKNLGGDQASLGDFSPDGKMFAVRVRTSSPASSAGQKYGVRIYNVSDASLLRTVGESSVTVSDTSFNKDGTMIAVIKEKAPFVEIYNVSTGELVYSFNDILSAKGAGCFVKGTNEIIVADGANVRVFDCSASEPQEIENHPVYQCSGVPSFMRSNRSGTRVGIMNTDSDTVEIWGRV